MARKGFKFSVIIPIYNVERYLREALDSVIGQTLSFQDNIQLVLVNDGSPDNSEEICLEYKAQYPKNITYIKQKNGGVSAARNTGLEAAIGEYVGFLDPDDKVSRDCYEKVKDFIDNHQEVGVFSYSIHFFGSLKGPHAVNDKFDNGSRVVNLALDGHQFVQSNVASVFIKRDLIGDVRFDKKLKYGEDGKFINSILLETPVLGLVADAVYFYRKRGDGTSAVDGMVKDTSWYFDLINRYLIEIAQMSINKQGYVTQYVQNIILHDLRWRFQQAALAKVLTDDLQQEYRNLIKRALQFVDDENILNFKYIRRDLRAYMLQYKHGIEDPDYLNRVKTEHIQIAGVRVDTLFTNRSVFVDIIEKNQAGDMVIEGWYEGVCNTKRVLKFHYRDINKQTKIFTRKTEPLMSLGSVARYRQAFRIELPKDEVLRGGLLSFSFSTPSYSEDVPIIFGYHTRLSSPVNHSYRVLGSTLLSVDYSKNVAALKVEEDSSFAKIKKELQVSARIVTKKDFLSFGARITGWILRKVAALFGKKIWLFIDRPLSATDNGYAMFEYVTQHKKKEILPVFVLAKESKDRDRLKKMGIVVDFGASLHKVFLYASSKVLSAHFDGFAFNPYAHRAVNMRIGLIFDLVYLQHGVLAADLSELINKYSRNIKLITAASDLEAASIASNKNYGYTKDNVVTAGQARFDVLMKNFNKKSKIILLAPTWRFNLVAPPKNINGRVLPGRNEKNGGFKDTDYFHFYNTLINDERLLQKLSQSGYKIRFCLHPQLAAQLEDFQSNDRVEILSEYNHAAVLEDAALMITDYSGVAFDFAYTKRPLIYTQYDAKSFYTGHTYGSGYYSFKKHGFGPIAEDVNSAVDQIIKNIDDKMKMSAQYRKRVDTFFKYIDTRNSERIYKAVSALEKKGTR